MATTLYRFLWPSSLRWYALRGNRRILSLSRGWNRSFYLGKHRHPETWPHFIHAWNSGRNQVWQWTTIPQSLVCPIRTAHGFPPSKITPAWPKANSESERFMRTIQKTLRAAHLENKDWKQELFLFLRNYRATPHSTTGVSPAELLFGRNMNVKIPELVPTSPSRSQFADTDLKKKEKMKEYANTATKARPHSFKVGDTVLVRQRLVNKLSSPYNKHPYTIVQIKGSIITARNATSYITRNSSQFKKVTIPTQQDYAATLLTMKRSTIPHRTILWKSGVTPRDRIGDLQNS